MNRLLITLCLLTAVAAAQTTPKPPIYKVVTLTQLVTENPANWGVIQTHIIVAGYIIGNKAQSDGDTHMVVCDAPTYPMTPDGSPPDMAHCFVAEQSHSIRCFAYPSYPTKLVNIKGVSRYDAQNPGHHWWEIHPVELITNVDGTVAPECFTKGTAVLPN